LSGDDRYCFDEIKGSAAVLLHAEPQQLTSSGRVDGKAHFRQCNPGRNRITDCAAYTIEILRALRT